jgi:hypothetical protein
MFSIPNFDPSSMTDDELSSKIFELSRALSTAGRLSAAYSAVEQLQNMIGAIQMELRDRSMRDTFDARQAMFPSIIETEPDLAVKPVSDKEKREKPQRAISRQRSKTFAGTIPPRRTSRPATNDADSPKDPA